VEQPLSSTVPLPVAPQKTRLETSTAIPQAPSQSYSLERTTALQPPRPIVDEREDKHEAAVAAMEHAVVFSRPTVELQWRPRAPGEPENLHQKPEPKEDLVSEEKKCTKCTKKLRVDNTKGVCAARAACDRRAAAALPKVDRKKWRKVPKAPAQRLVAIEPVPDAELRDGAAELQAFFRRDEKFPGMPAYPDVPIGWTVGFLKFLRDAKVDVDGIAS
jgi:hypothetical protein